MNTKQLLVSLVALLIGLAPVFVLQTATKEEQPMNTSGFDMGKLRVGTEVSGAYVQPGSVVTSAPDEIKATGFVYDESKLTYKLVWADEFDTPGLPDPERWDYDLGGSGWGNNELQFYTGEGNAWIKDGFLIIEARKEQRGNRAYTSARLVTRGKGDWLYGRFEIRAKMPRGLGTWPAIWMLPTDRAYGGWPASGEIDIMEHVGFDQGVTHASVHTKAFNHVMGTQKSANTRLSDISEEFHTYTLTWLLDKLSISVDGKVYFTYEPGRYVAQPTFREWPFDRRHHLLLNIAFGGNWGGARGIDENALPQRMLVDYVRVYQSPEITTLMKGE